MFPFPSGARAPDTLHRKLLILSVGCAMAASAAAETSGADFRMQVIGKGAQVQRILDGDYGAAIAAIEHAPTTYRTVFSNTNNLCVAYTLSGDYEHAGNACGRAVKIARRQSRLWYNDLAQRSNLATALSNSGVLEVLQQLQTEDTTADLAAAERLFEEAAGLRVAHTDATYNLKLLRQSQQLNVASVP